MEEDYRGAKEIYRKLIESESEGKTPADTEFLYRVYERYFLMREATGAVVISQIRNLEETLKKVPDCAQLWMMLGQLHEDSDVHPEQAAECYRKAHEANPYHEAALAKVIDCETEKENWQAAMVYCDRMINNTGNREYYLVQAACAMELGMDEAFAGDIAAFCRLGGDEKDTYALCSAYALQKGDYAKASGKSMKKQLDSRAPDDVPCYSRWRSASATGKNSRSGGDPSGGAGQRR